MGHKYINNVINKKVKRIKKNNFFLDFHIFRQDYLSVIKK